MIYSQNDSRWRNILLGFNTSTQYTIGTAGCYVTSIANVSTWAGNSQSPLDINNLAKERGWFVNGGQVARDDIPALLCSNLGFTGRTNWTEATPMDFFNDANDPNVTYIIEIDASHAPGVQTHFVRVVGKPTESDLTIDDSWDGVQKPLSVYGIPSAIIQSAIRFVRVAAAPAPVAPPYTMEQITTKEVVINKATSRWGINHATFDQIAADPLAPAQKGDIFYTSSIAHHQCGENYYVEDGNPFTVPNGFNVKDCDDYVAPAPATPASPGLVAPSAAPMPFPAAEKYKLVTTVMYFGSADDATNRRRAVSTLDAGTYFVIAKQDRAYNLSADLTKDDDQWVNIVDNMAPKPDTTSLTPPAFTTVEPPLPDPVDPATPPNWHSSLDLRYAGLYVFWNNDRAHDPNATTVAIMDLETGKQLTKAGVPLAPSNGQYAQFSGKVQWTDGNWYGRLKDTGTDFNWYAAKIEDLLPYADVYGTATTLQERQVLHTVTPVDRIRLVSAKIKTIGRNIMDILPPKEKK